MVAQASGPTTSAETPDPEALGHQEVSKEERARLLSRGFEPVDRRDWFMLGLAALDVLMLLARDVYSTFIPKLLGQAIIGLDILIVVIFGIEFLTELRRASNKLGYVRTHWYEVIGLVPVAHWGFRAFRLVRLLRYYVVTHFPPERYEDRTWHSAMVRGVIGHYRDVLLEEITDPIVLASIHQIRGPLVRAQFAATLGASLDERRENLKDVVSDAVRHTRGVGQLMNAGLVQRIVDNTTDAVLDTLVHTLNSEQLNQVISDSIGDVLDEVRQRVKEKEYRVAGGSVLAPTGRRS